MIHSRLLHFCKVIRLPVSAHLVRQQGRTNGIVGAMADALPRGGSEATFRNRSLHPAHHLAQLPACAIHSHPMAVSLRQQHRAAGLHHCNSMRNCSFITLSTVNSSFSGQTISFGSILRRHCPINEGASTENNNQQAAS